MKKNDFKKLAIMGIASSALLAAHSGYATPAVFSTSSQNTYLAGGSCGGHGGCKANPNHRSRDKTIKDNNTLAFFGFGESKNSDKDLKDKSKNPNKDLKKDTDIDQDSFDHDAGSVGSDKGSISKLAFFGKDHPSSSDQNRDISADQRAADDLTNEPDQGNNPDKRTTSNTNINTNQKDSSVALSDDAQNSDVDSHGSKKDSRESSYGDKAASKSSNGDNFDNNDENSDDDMALNDSAANDQDQAADAATNNTTPMDAASGNDDNS